MSGRKVRESQYSAADSPSLGRKDGRWKIGSTEVAILVDVSRVEMVMVTVTVTLLLLLLLLLLCLCWLRVV